MFSHVGFDDHEMVSVHTDRDSGLRAVIAVHSTRLGPSFGGVRMHDYASLDEALADALRLSRAMTRKAAICDLPYGGGKAVILGDPARDKTPKLLRAMGRAIDTLGGRYLAAEDVGTDLDDLRVMRETSAHLIPPLPAGVEPAPATAYGVLMAIQAAVRRTGRRDLEGLRVAVQGLGKVGAGLCRFLAEEGARLVVADVDAGRLAAVADLGARVVDPEAILSEDVDVLAPCALGGILNATTIPTIRARIVAGAANNQLEAPGDAIRLMRRGIVHVPDFVASAGGVIDFHHAGPDYDPARVLADVARIRDLTRAILARAEREGVAPETVALGMVEDRLRAGPRLPEAA